LQISNIPSWVTMTCVAIVCLFALWKGGPHERLISAVHAGLVINGYVDLVVAVEGVWADVITLVVCFACALRSRSYWTIWASAAALLAVVTDIVYLANPAVSLWAMLSAGLLWIYVLTTAIVCGVLARMLAASPPAALASAATAYASR
jgi:hypothetical protein